MIKEIKYGGFTASPSDYESPDGELAALIGLIPEEGSIKPILPPLQRLKLDENAKVMFIHKTSTFTNLIILKSFYDDTQFELWYHNLDNLQEGVILKFTKVDLELTSINAIGNTLVLVATQTPYFLLWNGNDYTNLGKHLPEIYLSFGLVGHPMLFSKNDSSKSTFTIEFDAIRTIFSEFPDTQQTQITEQIMAKVNKFLADHSVNKGRFAMPFFVRYAIRLYDGSLVMHSAPILMNPCTTNNPIVMWKNFQENSSGFSKAECDIMLMTSELDYCFNSVLSDDLNDWKDIVKSVDIFISKPIYTYDQNGKIKKCRETDDFNSVFIGRFPWPKPTDPNRSIPYITGDFDNDGLELLKLYNQWTFAQIYSMCFSADRTIPKYTFRMPEFSDEKKAKALINNTNFYLLHSIPIDELTTERSVIPIEDDYLQSLVAREVMTDDYQSHDKVIPKYTFGYNNRMNFANISRQLYKGFPMSAMVSFCNTRINFQVQGTTIILSLPNVNFSTLTDKYSVIVYIKENGEDLNVTTSGRYDITLCNFLTDKVTESNETSAALSGGGSLSGGSITNGESWATFFFYPNVNAYKMKIVPLGLDAATQSGKSYDIILKRHDYLNGAYAFLGYNIVRESSEDYNKDTNDSSFLLYGYDNKIYTSEINNPFYFPVTGINTVGTGSILGISSAAKALSQGQFGQFPLYAFTTEGVWALEVSNTGGYSAKQPITRDVCISADSITQLDSAVLFATDRGIMLISGSNSQCISDVLDYSQVFSIDSLPEADKLVTMAGLKVEDLAYVPFHQFLLGCRMIYVYTKQRVIVYNPAHSYAYVYSLKTKTWGMMKSDVADNVPSYPEALAMIKDCTLVDFCTDAPQQQDDNGHLQGIKGLIITRPLKFDAPDLLKTIDTAIQRGNFQKGSIKSVLYGSRDMHKWSLIWTSQDHYLRGFRGTPYKYFRFAVLCDMQPDESLFGATIQYTPRLLNQPR